MTSPTIDTPDYQQGVVSAQALLAEVAANETMATVGVPPNAESLLVVGQQLEDNNPITVVGVTSGYPYAGSRLRGVGSGIHSYTYAFDVSSAVDEQVIVALSGVPAGIWYVYADSGIHIVADVAKLTNVLGQVYTIPSVPNTAVGDHPPNELQALAQTFSGTATMLAAPGAGKRYRLFTHQLTTADTDLVAFLYDSAGGLAVNIVAGAQNAVIPLLAQGFAMTENSSLECVFEAGSGPAYAVVYYTTETV